MISSQLKNVDWNQPVTETHYFQWLEVNGEGHRIDDLQSYLKAQGFEIGVDALPKDTVDFLQTIHKFWEYRVNIAYSLRGKRNERTI